MAVRVESFVGRMRPLVLLERNAEVDKAKQEMQQATEASRCSNGSTLFNLRCSEVEGGLLGRQLLTLARNVSVSKGGAPPDLPAHKFTPHDIIELRPSKGGVGELWASGLVYRVNDTAITVAIDDLPEEGGLDQVFRIDKLANEVTFNRMCSTLDALNDPNATFQSHGAKMLGIAFDSQVPTFSAKASGEYYNENLDETQRRAVDLALQADALAMVHGPPGTGKTTTVIEIIAQEVKRGNRVLACAASNIAVDNIVDRLARLKYFKHKTVRLGHPARLLPEVLSHCLEAHVKKTDNSSLAKDIQKEIKALNAKMLKLESWKRAERNQIRRELRKLSKEQKQRQEKAVVEVLNTAAVVCSTLSGTLGKYVKDINFDVVVIDEAAQALEVSCWSALLKCRKAILAGDHLQLPPTIISEEASKKGLQVTLFERLHDVYGEVASVMLTEQYRMNRCIMQWSSDELYQSELIAHETVANHTLNELEGVQTSVDIPVCLFVDTAGCDCEEILGEDGLSRANPDEARAVMVHASRLLSQGVKARDMGIITPYNGQVALLRELRTETLQHMEISSVDGFQGREKEAILISTVRSNENGEIGFLNDRRRMNVAITRARRHCAVFGDSGTLSVDPFLERLVSYFESNGEYRSYEEFVQES